MGERSHRHVAMLCGILLACLTWDGCAGVEKNVPQTQYYGLEINRESEGGPSPSTGTVLHIRRFRIVSQYSGQEFVYRKSDVEYETDAYNRWVVFPDTVLTEQAYNWFSASGVFQYVVDSSSRFVPTHTLEGKVTAFYGDYRNPEAPKAVFELRAFLVRHTEGRSQIIFQRDYRRDVHLSAATPPELVRGWTDALRDIFTALEENILRVDLTSEES